MTGDQDLLNQRVHAFLDDVAARKPTPGGGSVAAAAGALAVTLARMVVGYSGGKSAAPATVANVDQAAECLAQADAMLRRLANEDATAYQLYVAGRKSGDPVEAARSAGVAAAVPLEIAAVASSALGILDRFKTSFNVNLVSDLGVAAVLADACVQAALYNVRVNLRDGDRMDPEGEVREEVSLLLENARRARESVVGFVEGYL